VAFKEKNPEFFGIIESELYKAEQRLTKGFERITICLSNSAQVSEKVFGNFFTYCEKQIILISKINVFCRKKAYIRFVPYLCPTF
jgi:hypothetical protein